MVKPWEEYAGEAVEESGPWDEYRGEEPKVGALETMGVAGSQGFSLGWGDELSPLVEKGFAKLFMGDEDYENVYGKRDYKTLRDEYRQDIKEAKESHPLLYGATEIAASMPALIATAGKATAPAKLAAIGGLQGGVMSAGASEKTGAGLLGDTALGTALGTGLGYAGGKLTQLIKPKAPPVMAETQAAKEAIETGAAKTAASEAPELAQEAAEAGIKTPTTPIAKEVRPPITPQDTLLAKLGQKDVNVVAYGRTRGGERVLKEAPSLDSSAPNNLRSKFDEVMERVSNKIDDYEQQAGELIEKSNVTMSNAELANTITKSMDEIKNSGMYASEAGKAAYKTLKRKLGSFIDKTKGEDGKIITAPKAGARSAKWLREYIQGLREENKAFFSKVGAGTEYSSAQEAVQSLTKAVDETLKTKIPGYRKLMQGYSKDLRAYMGVKKSMGRQTVADFFTNKVKKPAQDMLFGTRAPDEKWVATLKDFGDAAGEDILGQAKDRLAYAHLFPDKVSTAEMPTATQEAASFAHGLMKMPISPTLGAIEVAKSAVKPIKRTIFEKSLESTVDPAAKRSLYLRLAEKAQKMKPGLDRTREVATEGMESPVTKAAGMEILMTASRPEPDDDQGKKAAALSQFNQKYAPVLKDAIKRGGGHSFAVTNYLLQQKDENYRKLLQDVYENK